MTARLILPHDAPREQWLEARRHGVTATECAVIAGLTPEAWNSSFALYHRKIGDLPEVEANDVMRLGNELEPYVLTRFCEAHPEFIVRSGALYAHPERDWQIATPDGLAYKVADDEVNLAALVEAKTTSSWDHWSDEDIPVYYRAQCLWQLDVMGVDVVYLAAVNRATGEYREYTVERDEEDLKILRNEAELFLDRIKLGDPPDVDASPATTHALKGIHPDLDDTEVEVPADLAARYARACDAEKDMRSFKRKAENELRAAMRTARKAVHDGQPVATRSVYARAGFYVPPTPEDQPIDKLQPARRKK